MLFSERLSIEKQYYLWLETENRTLKKRDPNAEIEDCAMTLLGFLDMHGFLKQKEDV